MIQLVETNKCNTYVTLIHNHVGLSVTPINVDKPMFILCYLISVTLVTL
ncbi:hypothetical protein [Enterococcus phage vB_Efs19_KEN07]